MALLPGPFFLRVLLWVGYLGEQLVRSPDISEPTPAVMLVAVMVRFLAVLGVLFNVVALVVGLMALIGRRDQRLFAVLGIALSGCVLVVAYFQDVVWTPLNGSQATPVPKVRHVGDPPHGDMLPFKP